MKDVLTVTQSGNTSSEEAKKVWKEVFKPTCFEDPNKFMQSDTEDKCEQCSYFDDCEYNLTELELDHERERKEEYYREEADWELKM